MKCVSQYLDEHGSPLEEGGLWSFLTYTGRSREFIKTISISQTPKILNLNFESDCMVVHKRGRKVGKLGKE